MIKLSDYIFDFLKQKNVCCVFMLPGGGAMHLVDSLGKSGIQYVAFMHEQGASIAAESYAQHTNTPGVVLVTSGPGSTNAVTAVTAGWIDSTPMFVLSGQAKRSDLVGDRNVRQIGSQEVQIIPMVKGITKYAVQILDPETIRFHLERAWYEATTGRPGPVWLDIPLDVQGSLIDEKSLTGYDTESESGSLNRDMVKAAAKKTLELLETARKPLFLAGNGIKLSGAEELCRDFVKKLNLPVQTTWKAIDMFAEDDANYVGHPGIMGDRGANLIIQEADLLIVVGSRLDTSLTAFNDRHFAKAAKRIIVDIDANEIARMDMEKEVAVACDAGVFLNEINRLVQADEKSVKNGQSKELNEAWLAYCKHLRKKHPVIQDVHREAKDFVSSYYFIDRLCDVLTPEDVIVPESSGQPGEITYQAFRLKYGQKMKNAAGLGSMGFGLPYAIGACIANQRRRTVLINGDGAFQLNIQELETIHRLGLPIKMFIWMNDGYASIRAMQRNNFEGRYVASGTKSGFTVPNVSRIAEAYGFRTCRICNNRELDERLSDIFRNDEAFLCEVMVDPMETISPRVKAHVGKNGEMQSGFLENMWPEEGEGTD